MSLPVDNHVEHVHRKVGRGPHPAGGNDMLASSLRKFLKPSFKSHSGSNVAFWAFSKDFSLTHMALLSILIFIPIVYKILSRTLVFMNVAFVLEVTKVKIWKLLVFVHGVPKRVKGVIVPTTWIFLSLVLTPFNHSSFEHFVRHCACECPCVLEPVSRPAVHWWTRPSQSAS